MNFRSLTSALMFRSRLANIAGKTFGGKRDQYKTLGYIRELQPWDYRSRYRRNEVANRIVKALPKATWRGGVDIVEDEDPETETAFEAAWADLEQRLKITQVFQRADILAGIGRYAIILIGAPGELETPLEHCSAEEIVYLTPFAEEDATIQKFITDITSPRFGLPEFYSVKRTTITSPGAINAATIGRQVHWTRCFHIADGLLDDNLYGEPRLECVWNRLDDLEKVVGGGAEAFWKRADKGIQFDLDPTLDFKDENGSENGEKAKMREQIDEYDHELRRSLFTRGLKINELGSDVADFKSPVESVMSLICAGCGIPQRVLMGSEQGKLAAKQDRANWDNRVADRQNDFAEPYVIRPFVQKMIDLGALPKPVDDFDVRWSAISIMDDEQRASVATQWAGLNHLAGETVVGPDEIRERVLDLPTREEAGVESLDSTRLQPEGTPKPAPTPKAAAGKGGATGSHIHQVADRFRSTRQTYHARLVQRRATSARQAAAAERPVRKGREARAGIVGYGIGRIREELGLSARKGAGRDS